MSVPGKIACAGLAWLCAISILVAQSGAGVGGVQSSPRVEVAKAKKSKKAVPMKEESSYAVLVTSKGKIVCKLFPKSAPKTVANFLELAQGKKAWTDPKTGQKVTRPLYGDTVFHRVIPDFMIQGGDPLGSGMGGPGYSFDDEFDPNLKFDRPGKLAMANAGPNTNGSQFFITVKPTAWLNGKHTIFGEVVSGQDVANTISKAPRDANDRPLEPVVLEKILIQSTP